MKKLLYCAVALAMTLFAGSCQKENLEQVKGGKTVSFTVAAPGQIQTKAIADGMNVDVLHYEVYSREDGAPNQLEIAADSPLAKGHVNMTPQQDPKFPNDPEKVINTATVELDLLKDQDLTIIFWAQVKGAGYYNVTTDGSTDLRKISFKPGKQVDANVEDRAAFYKRVDFNTDNNLNHEVELVRPFAQLNLGTTNESLTPVQPGQTIGYSIDVLKSEVTVKGICTTFNTVTGLGENTNEEVVYVLNDTPYQQTKNDSEPEVLTVQDKPYHYVSMNYLFVPGGDKLVEVSYTVKTDKGDIQNTIKNVPVKQNFRTNIIGNLLTQKTKFDIVVDEEFNKPDIDLEYKADGLVQVNPDLDASATSYTKMYEISSANGFVYAMTQLVPSMKDGESAEFYLLNTVDLEGMEYVASNVPAGVTVLLAKGAAPITRSSSDEIVIKGLKSAIFAEVENGATATFSGIVVDDYSGAGAALVEVNNGTVVLSACDATNETDVDVDLVGSAGSGDSVDVKDGVSTLEQLQAALRTNAVEIKLASPITIPAGTEVVLDLNGKIVSQEVECSGSYSMITNNGILTVTGNGIIRLEDLSNGGGSEWGSYVIENHGELIIENGNIEHLGTADGNFDTCIPIQNYAGKVVVNGGRISSPEFRSLRDFTAGGAIEINGGVFNGQVWMQGLGNGPSTLTINGGEFAPTANDASSVFITNATNEVNVSITGGMFNTKIGCSDANKEGVKGSITGGTFTTSAKETINTALLADGYVFCQDGDIWRVYTPIEGISNVAQLRAFAWAVNKGYDFSGKTVKLNADIDLNNEQWYPIGKDNTFDGTFDGNGFTISNLKYHTTESDWAIGLFGCSNNATFKNFTINNVDFNIILTDDEDWGHIGAVVGYASGSTIIENINLTGDVKIVSSEDKRGSGRIGGILGGNYGSFIIKNVNVNVNEGSYVKGSSSIGGIAGQLQGQDTYENIESNIDVTANLFAAGGIVGIASAVGSFTNCLTTGNVTLLSATGDNNPYRLGGIAGCWADNLQNSLYLTNCSYNGTLNSTNLNPYDCDGYVGRGYSAFENAKVVVNGVEYIYHK